MVRLAEPKDLPFLKHAWQVCFEDPASFIDWNFAQNFSYSDTIVAEADGVPASNMQLMPHKIRLRHMEYDINYVSGVATLPEFRRRGLVREMFGFAFAQMKQRRQPISLLVPFDYGFYEKFGYRQCYEKTCRYAQSVSRRGAVTAKHLGPQLISRLDRLYVREMENRTGYVLRTPETWRRILEDLLVLSKGFIRFHQTGDQEDGYALITAAAGGYELHEVCGVCDIEYESKVQPFAMARIVDPLRVLRDMTADFQGELRIRITDENILENNMDILIKDGRITPCEGYDSEVSIKYLAQLVFGCAPDFTHTGLFSPQETYLNMIF